MTLAEPYVNLSCQPLNPTNTHPPTTYPIGIFPSLAQCVPVPPPPHTHTQTCRHTFPFMLSCANLGLEDTNSSQFFMTLAPCANLDGFHTCFGKVLRGYSTVKEVRYYFRAHVLHCYIL